MADDPTKTDPDNYKTIFENDHVRVLEYRDTPGHKTQVHHHPNAVVYTLSSFQRRFYVNGNTREADIHPGQVIWLDAQDHAGENIGATDTHVIFVELKR